MSAESECYQIKNNSIKSFLDLHNRPLDFVYRKNNLYLGLDLIINLLAFFFNFVFRTTIQNVFVFTSGVLSVFYVIITTISPFKC